MFLCFGPCGFPAVMQVLKVFFENSARKFPHPLTDLFGSGCALGGIQLLHHGTEAVLMGKLIDIIFRQLPCVGANSLMQVRQTHEIMDAGIGLKIGKVVLGHYFSLVAECRPHVEPVFGDADQCGVFAEDDFRQFGGQIFMYFHFAYLLADGRGISQRVYGNNFQTIARPLFIEKVVAVIVQEVTDAFLSVGVLREKVESSIGADSLEKIQFHVAVPGVFINHYGKNG